MSKRLNRYYHAIILLLLFMLCGGGCWDRRELKTQAIVSGVGVDLAAGAADKYVYSYQIIKPGEIAQPKTKGGGGGGGSPVWVGQGVGGTAYEATSDFLNHISRVDLLSHNQAYVVGKQMAAHGIYPLLDIELRYYQVRTLVPFLIAKGTAREVLEFTDGLEKISGFDIPGLLRESQSIGEAMPVTMQDFFGYLVSKTRAPVAPQIEVVKAGKSTNLRISGTAVFKKDRMIGELNKTETRGLSWVLGQVKGGCINITSGKGTAEASTEILSAGGRFKPLLHRGQVLMQVQVNAEMFLTAIYATAGLTDPEKLEKKLRGLKKRQDAIIRKEILAAWAKARLLKADIFGFGEAVHQEYRRQWKDMEPQWEKIFPQIKLEIKVDSQIRRIGEIVQPAMTK